MSKWIRTTEVKIIGRFSDLLSLAEDILVDVRCNDKHFSEVDPKWYRDFLKFYTSLEAKHDKEEREFIFERKHIALFLKIGRRPNSTKI